MSDNRTRFRMALHLVLLLCWFPMPLCAQGTRADYERADSFDVRTRGLVVGVAEEPHWIGETNRFWYRKSVVDGNAFVLVDPNSLDRRAAFDHGRVAASLNAQRTDSLTAVSLPFTTFDFVDEGGAIRFVLADSTWRCDLVDYLCENAGPVPERAARGGGVGYQAGPGQLWRSQAEEPLLSPDSTLEAFIQNFNVAVREVGKEEYTLLSQDGSEGNRYTHSSMVWSPDSEKLAVYRVIPGYEREIHYVQSSPEDQLQPKHSTLIYAKPGDVLDKEQPVVFHVAEGRRIDIDDALFSNAYALSELEWRKDSRRLTFEYNQRGHEVYRIIEIDAEYGATRAVISEEPETFFYYSNARGNGGTRYRHDLDDGEEIIWMSERDGWAHLYLYDGTTGEVKKQITSGDWVVRAVDRVDEENRQIWFQASGMYEGKDPYFLHYYRINFDGSGLTAYTDADGQHAVSFSPNNEFYVDRRSRVDLPPVAVLRRTSDRETVMELERANDSALLATGWQYPEVFVAKGRDGTTDIWGVIIRPTNFDPAKSYPVIEYIYAGPHSAFVPKSFSTQRNMQSMAELGFVVVQMDGMGTALRSKAFHDVSWKNIGDGGFPDRILWHQAVAAQYPWYDISQVGIYGTSAGGQNSMGALLFHPEFYSVAVSAAGCHDNRMDKIWWNELWMSWPLGPHYAASSNVDNAWRLQGKLLLVLPELDTNVDPSSTLQVVNALIEADKDFDFLMVPGADHGSGGEYGVRKRYDFFVKNLLGLDPPDWNRSGSVPAAPSALTAYQQFARNSLSGDRARDLVAALDPAYRLPGNAPFDTAIYRVAELLKAAGYVEAGEGEGEGAREGARDGARPGKGDGSPSGPLTYRIERRPLSGPAWESVGGSLGLVGSPDPLMTLGSNINLVAANSFSTPPGGIEAELVYVGAGTEEDFAGKDVEGKIVMGDGSLRQLFPRAVQEHGALGVLAYRLSSYSRPEVNRDIAPMSSIPYDSIAASWGLLLSGNAREALLAALAKGPARVRVEVETRLYPSEELTLVAELRGEVQPEERLVFSAHVQESGANDNLTGVAAQAEIARTLALALEKGVFRPKRTITMIWGDEISSTRRFLEDDPVRAAGVRWGLSLDMVGEDTEKTGGTFLIEKMPDPSSVWTRGEDHHTEWGGRPLTLDQLTPHYLNDFVLSRCLDQAEGSDWVVKTNPYEGGSDHVPFLQAGTAGLLLWHFTDQFYHTDGDRPEMVSSNTLWNVGACAAVSAMTLVTADQEMSTYLIGELERAAAARLKIEVELSRAAIAAGGDPEEEIRIIESWTGWYMDALAAMTDLEAEGNTPDTVQAIEAARHRVAELGRHYSESMVPSSS